MASLSPAGDRNGIFNSRDTWSKKQGVDVLRISEITGLSESYIKKIKNPDTVNKGKAS